jgi:hypothetical protein
MDDVSWTAQGDTTVTLLHVAPRDDAPLAPPSLVSDGIAQVVWAIARSHTSRRNPKSMRRGQTCTPTFLTLSTA